MAAQERLQILVHAAADNLQYAKTGRSVKSLLVKKMEHQKGYEEKVEKPFYRQLHMDPNKDDLGITESRVLFFPFPSLSL